MQINFCRSHYLKLRIKSKKLGQTIQKVCPVTLCFSGSIDPLTGMAVDLYQVDQVFEKLKADLENGQEFSTFPKILDYLKSEVYKLKPHNLVLIEIKNKNTIWGLQLNGKFTEAYFFKQKEWRLIGDREVECEIEYQGLTSRQLFENIKTKHMTKEHLNFPERKIIFSKDVKA